MAKKAKKGNGKAKVAVKPEQPKLSAPKAKEAHKPQAPDLEALRKPVLDADAGLTKAEAEAKALVDKALALVAQGKGEYREALGLYREACRKVGVDCEFPGVVAAGDIVDRSDGIKVDSFSCCDRGGKRDLADCSVRGS